MNFSKIFERLRNYFSFRIVVSASVLCANLILIAAHDFSLPPLAIVFHVILMDLTVLVISYDKVCLLWRLFFVTSPITKVYPSPKPSEWKLAELAIVSLVVGVIGAFEVATCFWVARGGLMFFSKNLSDNELRAIT